jgi:hypothetical protein
MRSMVEGAIGLSLINERLRAPSTALAGGPPPPRNRAWEERKTRRIAR